MNPKGMLFVMLVHSDNCLTLVDAPVGSPTKSLLIKSDTVADVPCTDTAEVSDSWGMVAYATCVRLDWED